MRYMNAEVILGHKTTFCSSWIAGKGHAICDHMQHNHLIIAFTKRPHGEATDEKRRRIITTNAHLLSRIEIHIMTLNRLIFETLPIHYQVKKAADLLCINHEFKLSLTLLTGIHPTRKWRKYPIWTEFATHLHSCYCGNPVFLYVKGSWTSRASCPICYIYIDVILSNQTTSLSSSYSGKWHAIFRISLPPANNLIFMNRRCALICYR